MKRLQHLHNKTATLEAFCRSMSATLITYDQCMQNEVEGVRKSEVSILSCLRDVNFWKFCLWIFPKSPCLRTKRKKEKSFCSWGQWGVFKEKKAGALLDLPPVSAVDVASCFSSRGRGLSWVLLNTHVRHHYWRTLVLSISGCSTGAALSVVSPSHIDHGSFHQRANTVA